MKNLIFTLVFILASLVSIQAQSDLEYSRKGKFLIETNYSLSSAFLGGSTGLGLALTDGGTLINLGIDCGKFLNKNLALKGSLFVLSADGESIIGMSTGIKYYLFDKLILSPSAGILNASRETVFLGGMHIGYAIKLADNIYLEPGFGARVNIDARGVFEIRIPFMMLF